AIHSACLDRIESSTHHNDGNRLGRILGRLEPIAPSRSQDEIQLETHQLGRKLRLPAALSLRISVLDGDVLSFYVAKLAQSQLNCLDTGGVTNAVALIQIPYARDLLCLLRVGGKVE